MNKKADSRRLFAAYPAPAQKNIEQDYCLSTCPDFRTCSGPFCSKESFDFMER